MFQWQCLILLLLINVHLYRGEQCDKFTKLHLSHVIIGTNLQVKLLLYTRENVTCGTVMSHSNLSASPALNISKPTIFVIHGFRPTGSPPGWLDEFTKALLAREDANVIVVDWNRGAATSYFKALENTRKAADNITAFIELMMEHGASLSTMHLIGFSLGAHMSGFIGANLNGLVGRITGLDPAGVMYTGSPPEDRLDSTDAQFVDVLHTDIDALGYREPLGHIDFYANGGTDQPDCPKTIFSGQSYFKCDHQRSVSLFLDSLEPVCSSRAYPCSSYKDFLNGDCMSCDRFGAAGCPVFGYDVTQWKDVLLRLGETKTFFTTNAKTPFCMTNYRVEVTTWNTDVHWGYITVKLHYNGTTAIANIDHTASKFEKYTKTTLLGQFDKDIQAVEKVSLIYSTGNIFKQNYKLRILRIRLTHLERKERSLCRYDILLEHNKEVTFRPIPCQVTSF